MAHSSLARIVAFAVLLIAPLGARAQVGEGQTVAAPQPGLVVLANAFTVDQVFTPADELAVLGRPCPGLRSPILGRRKKHDRRQQE